MIGQKVMSETEVRGLTDLSAKDFKDPLLAFLRKAGAEVDANTAFHEVLSQKGLQPFQFGIQESSKACWIKRWFGLAMRELVQEGLTAFTEKKGVWKALGVLSEQTMEAVLKEDGDLLELLKEGSSCYRNSLHSSRSKECKACICKEACQENQTKKYQEFMEAKINNWVPKEAQKLFNKEDFFPALKAQDAQVEACKSCGAEIKPGEEAYLSITDPENIICTSCYSK